MDAGQERMGPVEKDRSNGEQDSTDGKPMGIRANSYSKGLGVHAPSEVDFPLRGKCLYFLSDIGVDNETAGAGTVQFQVWGDTALLFESAILKGTSRPVPVHVPLGDVVNLKLVVNDGGDDIGSDHSDWGAARVICRGVDPSNKLADLPHSDSPSLTAIFSDARGALRLAVPAAFAASAEIEVRDQSGKILPGQLIARAASDRFEADWKPRDRLPRGLLFVVMKYGARRYAAKAMVLPQPGGWPSSPLTSPHPRRA